MRETKTERLKGMTKVLRIKRRREAAWLRWKLTAQMCRSNQQWLWVMGWDRKYHDAMLEEGVVA